MSADEMFEELGYEKRENNWVVEYIKKTEELGEKFQFEIAFVKNNKFIGVHQLITMQELKAINEKCKELGWLHEK